MGEQAIDQPVVRVRHDETTHPANAPLQGRLAVGYSPVDLFVEPEARVAARQERTGIFERPTDRYAVFDLLGGVRPRSTGGSTS